VTIPSSGHTVNVFFGATPTLTVLQNLTVTGEATLVTPVTIDGGTLSVGDLTNVALLTFTRGTLNLTGSGVAVVGSSGGMFGPSLSIGSGQVLGITDGTIGSGGTLRVQDSGQVNVGTLTNHGRVVMDGVTAYLGGTTLSNAGVLTGTGQVDAVLENRTGGQVQVGRGEEILFTASGNSNAGQLDAIGGEIEFTQDLTNVANTGSIAGRDATLRFSGGLTNDGSVALTAGSSDVFGDVNVGAEGRMIVSGGGTDTFYGDVANSGNIHVSAGSVIVYFGDLSGAGAFTGTGTTYIEGDIRPGTSPNRTHIEGDVVYGPLSSVEIELGGTEHGIEYDVFSVGGSLTLGGTLDVVLYVASRRATSDVGFHLLRYPRQHMQAHAVPSSGLYLPWPRAISVIRITKCERVAIEPIQALDDRFSMDEINPFWRLARID